MSAIRGTGRYWMLGLAMVLAMPTGQSLADSIESAAGSYTDDRVDVMLWSLTGAAEREGLFDGQGKATAARLGTTVKRVHFRRPGDLLEKQLAGKDRIEERSATVAIDQGVGVGTSVGIVGGLTEGPLNRSRNAGLRASVWWLEETLQTSLEARRNRIHQQRLEYTDTDGRRVRVPEEVEGDSFSATVTHLTTPVTILKGFGSYATRDDRPPAWSVGAEWRQYVTPTLSAIHLAVTHYENLGLVEPVSAYGTVVADSMRAEWHQHLAGRLILMGGYRYYVEVEKPRAADAPINRLGADAVYTHLRWRFGDGSWTAEAPEVYLFGRLYRTNSDVDGRMFGLGGAYPF